MNWLQRAIKKAQIQSSSETLLSVLRGEMDEMAAISQLGQINDPETCNNIAALLGDPRTTTAFPNAMATLYTIGNELKCNGGGEAAGEDMGQVEPEMANTEPMMTE